jgi:hypothetical protein
VVIPRIYSIFIFLFPFIIFPHSVLHQKVRRNSRVTNSYWELFEVHNISSSGFLYLLRLE